MQTLPHTKSCFVCGEANPFGLRLKFETDGQVVRARFTPKTEHNGFKQTVHGGVLATLLDEIMVWACAVRTKRFAYCAELTVRFQNPARPGEALTATGELVSNRRNKLFEAKGELRRPEGVVVASATGKYLPIPDTALADLLTDIVGDVSAFVELPPVA